MVDIWTLKSSRQATSVSVQTASKYNGPLNM